MCNVIALHLKSISDWFFFCSFSVLKCCYNSLPYGFSEYRIATIIFDGLKVPFTPVQDNTRRIKRFYWSYHQTVARSCRWSHIARSDCFHCSPETHKQSLHLKCMSTATAEDAKWDGKSIFNIFTAVRAQFVYKLNKVVFLLIQRDQSCLWNTCTCSAPLVEKRDWTIVFFKLTSDCWYWGRIYAIEKKLD